MFKFDQIYSRPILELKELRYVEILWLSCIVPERKAFMFSIFYSAWEQCNNLYGKVQAFIIQKIINWEVERIEVLFFLQMKAEIQANPCTVYFNDSAHT